MISAEEAEKIEQFRSILPPDLLTKKELEDDHYLVRWLRARNFNESKALEMLKVSKQWRRDHQVDGILERGEEIPERYRKIYPTGLLGRDSEDCVVLLLPLGRYCHRTVMEEVGMDAALRNNMIWMEKIMKLVKKAEEETGKKGLRIVEVVDMEHYSYRELTYGPARDFIVRSTKDFDSNYPEMVKHIVVINAPKLFTILFNIIKPFISKETLSKMSFHGGGNSREEERWKEIIRSRFDPTLVPTRWGGVRQGSDEFCSDDKDVWMDAPIPLQFFTSEPNLDGLKCERVGPRDSLKIEVPLNSSDYSEEANLQFSWECKVDSHDINFSVLFHPHQSNADGLKDETDVIIQPVGRINSKQEVLSGTYNVSNMNGIFVLMFDNTYSMARSKTVRYTYQLKETENTTN